MKPIGIDRSQTTTTKENTMHLSKKATSALVLSFMMGVAAQAAWAGEVKDREQNQQERIDKGVENGKLTATEVHKLDKGEAKIESNRQKALADGKLTHKEKRKLNHQENRESKKIFKLKHNKKNPLSDSTAPIPVAATTPKTS
jgi:hypothetical protein